METVQGLLQQCSTTAVALVQKQNRYMIDANETRNDSSAGSPRRAGATGRRVLRASVSRWLRSTPTEINPLDDERRRVAATPHMLPMMGFARDDRPSRETARTHTVAVVSTKGLGPGRRAFQSTRPTCRQRRCNRSEADAWRQVPKKFRRKRAAARQTGS